MGHTVLLAYNSLSWRAGLDILFISAALFFLCRTMLRLGTWKIALGIFVALAMFVVAGTLELKGLVWIYQNLSHVAVFALIVIFQPELRKILEQTVSMSGRRRKDSSGTLAPLIAECLGTLAGIRCGAIFVFPGREPIREKISGGYQLNAVPSKPLILSIFDPNSPGHDGAVIIEGNTVTRFGVRLPMSLSTRLSEEYGTRHHAAMGLAEQTDALVLVVSEERGTISLFEDGEMRPLRNTKEIVKAIAEHQAQTGFARQEKNRWIRRKTIAQIGASLMVASLFWLFLVVSQMEVVERILMLNIDYSSPAEDLALVGEKPTDVQVHITGPKSEIENLALNPPRVKIDLSRMAKGTQTIIITSENLLLPKGISLLDSSPSHLKLTLVPMVERDIAITPQIIGKLPSGLKIKKITVDPERVLVAVPDTKQDKNIKEVQTTPIYLESITRNTKLFCKVIARPTIQPIAKQWPDVSVLIEVSLPADDDAKPESNRAKEVQARKNGASGKQS